MTKSQKRVVERIRSEIEGRIERQNKKYNSDLELKEFEVKEYEYFISLFYEVNRTNGNIYTRTHGHITIGRRGGIKGRVENGIGTNELKLEGKKDLHKITTKIF